MTPERDPFAPLSAKVTVTKSYSSGGREQTPGQQRKAQAISILSRVTTRVLPKYPGKAVGK